MYSRFFWHEFQSDQVEATQAFLTSLFPAWCQDMVSNPAGPYHMFAQDGLPWVGLRQRPDTWPAPHIRPYVCVADIENTAQNIEASMGTILDPIRTIPGQGRALTVQDPSGAVLSLMQSDTPAYQGRRPRGRGQAIWNELTTRDAAAIKPFYKSICGWDFERAPTSHEYYYFGDDGLEDLGGVLPMVGKDWGTIPSHWMTYFEVENADAAVDQVKQLGGCIHVDPFSIADVGRLLVIGEPGGCLFTLFEPQS